MNSPDFAGLQFNQGVKNPRHEWPQILDGVARCFQYHDAEHDGLEILLKAEVLIRGDERLELTPSGRPQQGTVGQARPTFALDG